MLPLSLMYVILMTIHSMFKNCVQVLLGISFASINCYGLVSSGLSFSFSSWQPVCVVFFMGMMENSFGEWFIRLKCLATGFSGCLWFMANWCPVRLKQSIFSVSLMWWKAHLLTLQITLLVLQAMVALILNSFLVVVAWNVMPVFDLGTCLALWLCPLAVSLFLLLRALYCCSA